MKHAGHIDLLSTARAELASSGSSEDGADSRTLTTYSPVFKSRTVVDAQGLQLPGDRQWVALGRTYVLEKPKETGLKDVAASKFRQLHL